MALELCTSSNIFFISCISLSLSQLHKCSDSSIIACILVLSALTDEQLVPIPPINLQISEEVDERVGFFGHVILNISWDAPQSM